MKRPIVTTSAIRCRYALALLIFVLCAYHLEGAAQTVLYVSPCGDDNAQGTLDHPLKTISCALDKAALLQEPSIKIWLGKGSYHLSAPIEITSARLKGRSLTIAAREEGSVRVCGTRVLHLKWKKLKGGLYGAPVDRVNFDQLFINGQLRILARYPNYREGVIYNGTAADAIDEARLKRWKSPQGGFLHALHSGQWGGMDYLITGKRGNKLLYEGGFQNNRPSAPHPLYRFVENIREELDTAGEWFVSPEEKMLYYIPCQGEEMESAQVEVSCTEQLFRLTGTREQPLCGIRLQGLHLYGTCRTFMRPYERLMRSDWCLYRGAAIFMENTQDCEIAGCELYNLGGNAIFVSRYNLNDRIRGNHIHHIGAGAVNLVGDTTAVRSGCHQYDESIPYSLIDTRPGAANSLYPRECTVEDNLIHDIGCIEKQVAGVEIEIAARITVRHNSIYHTPRAAINIGDGAFGGHVIEYNDLFETVLETSDHGAFNSWGRDRYWHPNRAVMDTLTARHPELILLDARYTTLIRNNRLRCDHGWDIDLDDGSSNYHIYNNLCLSGGIKLREGFYRTVENNIMVNNSFHPHVWFPASGDVFVRNIVMSGYFPIALNGWGKEVDYNFFPTAEALHAMQKEGIDRHSLWGAIKWKNPAQGDYTPYKGSGAYQVGFEAFPMDQFGVYSKGLKTIARQPTFPPLKKSGMAAGNNKPVEWMEGTLRRVSGAGDRSAYGLPNEMGMIVESVQKGGRLERAGLAKGDVILSIEGSKVHSPEELLEETDKHKGTQKVQVTYFRNQKEQTALLNLEQPQ